MRQAVIGAICVAAFSIIVYAQRPPSNASSNSSGLTASWNNGATVNVYISTNSYPTGSANWNALTGGFNRANTAYEMNVTFNFVGYSGNPPAPQGNYVYVYQTVPTPGPNYEGYTSYNGTIAPGGKTIQIDSAAIQLNPVLSTPEALETAVTHEVSHTFGLGDCPDCGSTSDSIMYNPLPPPDSTTTYYPTYDDVVAQFTYYYSPE